MALTDRAISDDLYTKIALDNKLVSKFQVRKASQEQQDREDAGEPLEIGPLMVELGFLTERQHRSVLNACTYREQRDYDKRFGRQCLRMNLLDQERIEDALAEQKKGYMDSGGVTPLSEVLVERGSISADDVVEVEEGIRQRDAARARALADRARQVSSGSQRIPSTGSERLPATDVGELDDADLDDADLDDADLDDEDLDDADLDDAPGAPDGGLADLEDADLDDVDLDGPGSGFSDLDDAELESDLGGAAEPAVDADLDDADLDDADLDDADLDDVDLDDADLDDVDLDDDALVDDDFKLDLNDMDLDPDDAGSDEEHLVEDMSEDDSDVELDPEDLKELKHLESGEEREELGDWAPGAFDDRPISGEGAALPLPPPAAPAPLPSLTTSPKGRPQVPAAAGSQRGKVVEVAAKQASKKGSTDLNIPGDVFEEELSDMAAVPVEARARPAASAEEPVPLSPSDAQKLLERQASGRLPTSPGFDPADPELRAAFEAAFEEAKEQAWESFLARLAQRGS
ncbi:MAG: pentapeptide repeat-containing protein [Planctomycetota bacterium]